MGLKNNLHFTNLDHKDVINPYGIAIATLMRIMGVRRLFHKDDVFHLIKRTQLLYPDKDIMTNFFANGDLFVFNYQDENYWLKSEHITSHIGIEVRDDDPINYKEYSAWLSSGLEHITGITNMSFFEDKPAIDGNSPIKTERVTRLSRKVGLKNNISETQIANANLLAKSIADEIPPELFSRIEYEFPNKMKVLALQKAPFIEPLFDYNQLPEATKQHLWKHFWPSIDFFEKADEQLRELDLIYLAWLWANGFVVQEARKAPYVDIRITNFKMDEFYLMYGVYQIIECYEIWNLKALASILYDAKISKLAIRPWQGIDVYKKE